MPGDARAQPSPDGQLPLPYRFGANFTLFDRIGAGGMAEIYLAREKTRVGAPRLAVVKLVLPHLASDARFANLLIAEAKLAAQLSHANIVQTYDLGREHDRLYIAMEYVEGFDLNELLRRCSKARVALPAEFAIFIVGEALRALEYAHKKRDMNGQPLQIVHRDVSPSNVLISFEGEVKLCDFGIARAVATDSNQESVEGKASYMAPEHARGVGLDARSDVFSASVILWELMAGRRMYKASEGRDLLVLAREANVPPLPDRGLPDHARLAAIVSRGLAADPAARYPSALAMARDLDEYMMAHRMRPSPLKLGEFLMDHFGNEIVETRRARERASITHDALPAATTTTGPTTPTGPRTRGRPDDFDDDVDTTVTDRAELERMLATQPGTAQSAPFVPARANHPAPVAPAPRRAPAVASTPPAVAHPSSALASTHPAIASTPPAPSQHVPQPTFKPLANTPAVASTPPAPSQPTFTPLQKEAAPQQRTRQLTPAQQFASTQQVATLPRERVAPVQQPIAPVQQPAPAPAPAPAQTFPQPSSQPSAQRPAGPAANAHVVQPVPRAQSNLPQQKLLVGPADLVAPNAPTVSMASLPMPPLIKPGANQPAKRSSAARIVVVFALLAVIAFVVVFVLRK